MRNNGNAMSVRLIVVFAALVSLPDYAMACDDHAPGTEPGRQSVGRESAWVNGDVRGIDLEEGTITLAHGKIASLRMAPMNSMVFKAYNPGVIADAKPGDKVRFRVAMLGEQPTVTRLTVPAK